MADSTARSDAASPSLAHPIPGLPVNVSPAERLVSTAVGAALVGMGTQARGGSRAALTAVGGILAARGATGFCPAYAAIGHSSAARSVLTLDSAFTVNRPRGEVYAAWTGFDALVKSMEHVESIDDLGGGRSRWTAKAAGVTASWVAQETAHVDGRETAFRTVEGESDLEHAGRVTFEDARDGIGTVVRVHWRFVAPLGVATLAGFADTAFEAGLRADLYRFRALLEAGEVPTIEGQPKGDWHVGRPAVFVTSPV